MGRQVYGFKRKNKTKKQNKTLFGHDAVLTPLSRENPCGYLSPKQISFRKWKSNLTNSTEKSTKLWQGGSTGIRRAKRFEEQKAKKIKHMKLSIRRLSGFFGLTELRKIQILEKR